jgi:hypothetical protein
MFEAQPDDAMFTDQHHVQQRDGHDKRLWLHAPALRRRQRQTARCIRVRGQQIVCWGCTWLVWANKCVYQLLFFCGEDVWSFGGKVSSIGDCEMQLGSHPAPRSHVSWLLGNIWGDKRFCALPAWWSPAASCGKLLSRLLRFCCESTLMRAKFLTLRLQTLNAHQNQMTASAVATNTTQLN